MRYKATFTPTVDDDVIAYRMGKREGDSTRWLYILAGIALAVELAIIGHYADQPRLALVGIVGGAVSAATPFLVEWRVRRAGKKVDLGEVCISFSEEGVEMSSKSGSVKHAWEAFSKASLDDRGLLLFIAAFGCAFIPARAFAAGYFPRRELAELILRKLKNAKMPNKALEPTA